MSEEVYTVGQFAERLKLHPKTVLRFIHEGRVRAVKVRCVWVPGTRLGMTSKIGDLG